MPSNALVPSSEHPPPAHLTSSQLIDNDKTVARCRTQNQCHVSHFHKKCRRVGFHVVGIRQSRQHFIGDAKTRILRRHKASNVRHDCEEGDLSIG